MDSTNNSESETKLLYLDDSYQKEFDANILDVITVSNDINSINGSIGINNSNGSNGINIIEEIYIVLDQTLFYPRGGGQLTDTGTLVFDGKSYTVLEVIKRDGRVLHKIDRKGLKVHDIVHGVIDWNRRYMLMRMHTASHLLDAILYRDGKIMVTGNELGLEKTRIDFNMPEFSMDKVQEYVSEANKIIQKDLKVKNYYLSREEAFKISGIVKLASALPPNISVLRITEIVGLDIQADGGTHVHSLLEIGKINILSIENKGKDRKRIYFMIR